MAIPRGDVTVTIKSKGRHQNARSTACRIYGIFNGADLARTGRNNLHVSDHWKHDVPLRPGNVDPVSFSLANIELVGLKEKVPWVDFECCLNRGFQILPRISWAPCWGMRKSHLGQLWIPHKGFAVQMAEDEVIAPWLRDARIEGGCQLHRRSCASAIDIRWCKASSTRVRTLFGCSVESNFD